MDADRRLFDLTEFWLISAPGERTCQQTWDVMNSVTSKQANLSTNFKFHIPDLKVCYLLRCCNLILVEIFLFRLMYFDNNLILYLLCASYR